MLQWILSICIQLAYQLILNRVGVLWNCHCHWLVRYRVGVFHQPPFIFYSSLLLCNCHAPFLLHMFLECWHVLQASPALPARKVLLEELLVPGWLEFAHLYLKKSTGRITKDGT